jgi:hypothetical protein
VIRLTETAEQLVLHPPAWVGVLCLVVGIGLAIVIGRGKRGAKMFGPSVVVLLLLGIAWGAFVSSTTLDEKGVRVRGILGEEAAAPWSEIRSASVEDRARGRGGTQVTLVLQRYSGPELEIRLSTLPPEAAVRVIEFAKARAGKR